MTAPASATDLILDGEPFTRAIATSAGMHARELNRLLLAGRLRQPVRGIYVDAQVPDDLVSRAAAIRLRLPPGAAIARRTAAWLHGIDTRGPGEQDAVLPVECVVPLGVQPVRLPGVRCFQADVRDDLALVGGVACTTPVRTVVDLLRRLSPHMALACADEFAARSLVSVPAVLDAVDEWTGHPGIRQGRRLARMIEPLTESRGESWLRLRFADAGFPRPRAQIPLIDSTGRTVYRLDLGWDDHKVAVEYDGMEFHSGVEAQRRDRERDRRAEEEFAWRVFHVGRSEVLGRSLHLERAVAELLGLEVKIYRRPW